MFLLNQTLFIYFVTGQAEDHQRWHPYENEKYEAPLLLQQQYLPPERKAQNNDVGGFEPSFVSAIKNQTVSVGRDVILGCQVKNLGPRYKVSAFEQKGFLKTIRLLGFCQNGSGNNIKVFCFS